MALSILVAGSLAWVKIRVGRDRSSDPVEFEPPKQAEERSEIAKVADDADVRLRAAERHESGMSDYVKARIAERRSR